MSLEALAERIESPWRGRARGVNRNLYRGDDLGEALLREGWLRAAPLRVARARQAATGESLRAVLLEMGLATETSLARWNAARHGLAYVDLRGYRVDRELARMLPGHLAERHRMLALADDGEVLTVATDLPLNLLAEEEVARLCRRRVRALLAASDALDVAIEAAHGADASRGEVFRALDALMEVGEGDRNQDVAQAFVYLLVEVVRRKATAFSLRRRRGRARASLFVGGAWSVLQEMTPRLSLAMEDHIRRSATGGEVPFRVHREDYVLRLQAAPGFDPEGLLAVVGPGDPGTWGAPVVEPPEMRILG